MLELQCVNARAALWLLHIFLQKDETLGQRVYLKAADATFRCFAKSCKDCFQARGLKDGQTALKELSQACQHLARQVAYVTILTMEEGRYALHYLG